LHVNLLSLLNRSFIISLATDSIALPNQYVQALLFTTSTDEPSLTAYPAVILLVPWGSPTFPDEDRFPEEHPALKP